MSKRIKVPVLRLTLVILVYLILAIGYSIVVPIGRGADEWAHYWYAEFIAAHGRLPLNPAERSDAGYKADWPPLYHLTAAAVSGWVDTEGPPTFKYRADNIRRQLVPAHGPEAILHTEDELFPWRQEILIWHLGRFLSIVFSAGTLVVTYFVALEVFQGCRVSESQGRRIAGSKQVLRNGGLVMRGYYVLDLVSPGTLALISVAVLAFIPRFLFTGMLFNYDSLTLVLASLFLWLAIRIVKGHYARWGFWGLGLLAGLALVTKYSTVLLPVIIVVVAGRRVAESQGRRVAESQRRRVSGSQDCRVTGRGVERNNALHAPRSTLYALRSPVFWRLLGQAAIAYIAVTSWWFAYLIINFNEIDTYGPVLGTVAPLLRGDASDRTAEGIFAWLSGGQAPTLDYIEKQSYSGWQLVAQFLNTFWGNPVARPYRLAWFVAAMTLVTFVAAVGLVLRWRQDRPARFWIGLLLLYCLLPAPLMLFRLFGARDALEAVQGRHILFLAGPAVAILLVLGLVTAVAAISEWVATRQERRQGVAALQPADGTRSDMLRSPLYALRLTYYVLLALLLAGALGQLILMIHAYPPPLPARTAGMPIASVQPLPVEITLPGGAKAIGYDITTGSWQSLQVSLAWKGGSTPAPEDYQLELALVDREGQVHSGWRAFQTQARYPTRAWEPGDMVREEGWLPLAGVPPGVYEVRMRILSETGPVVDWQLLGTYTVDQMVHTGPEPLVWSEGEVALHRPQLQERETVQITFETGEDGPELVGPDGVGRQPVLAGPGWANFIVAPDWPAGDYYVSARDTPILWVDRTERNFQLPAVSHPLPVNFEGKIKLLGYDLPERRVEAGSGLPLTLHWQGLEWMGEEFVIFTRLLDNQGLAWGGYDRLARENYSTLLWAPGEIITDGFAVPVDPNAPDGVYVVSVGWYREVDGQAQSLSLVDPDTGQTTDRTAVEIGPVKVGGPPPGATVAKANPSASVEVVLGDQIVLMGYDLVIEEVEATQDHHSDNQNLQLTFFWETLRQPETDYTVFVHVRDEAGNVVAQKDSPPLDGTYPTGLWDSGEVIRDEIVVPVIGVPPGEYELIAGMYDFDTGNRLRVNGSSDGAILLQSVQINKED